MLLRNILNELTIPEALLFSSRLHSQLDYSDYSTFTVVAVLNFFFFFNSQLSLKFSLLGMWVSLAGN